MDTEGFKRAAILIAEAASLNAEIAAMEAENAWRARRGEAPAYCGNDFEGVRLSHPILNAGTPARFAHGD